MAAGKSRLGKVKRRNYKRLLWQKSQLCGICGKQLPGEKSKQTTLDHIIPMALGGADKLKNLQLAHWSCNNKKGSSIE